MIDYSLQMPFKRTDLGQGPGATAWLAADVDGDGYDELVQPYSSNSQLGLLVYNFRGSATDPLDQTQRGQVFPSDGYNALAWLVGDVDGDGREEVIQLWGSSTQLGITVYGWREGAMTRLCKSSDMGTGGGAYAFVVGDINNDGRYEVVQMSGDWRQLVIHVYAWSEGGMKRVASNDKLKAGGGALCYLIGDVNNDKRAEIVQLWANGERLGMIVYGWVPSPSGGGDFQMLFGTGDIDEGYRAVSWNSRYSWLDPSAPSSSYFYRANPGFMIGDIDGDGYAEIVHPWDSSGTLGMSVYGWSNGVMTKRWSSSNMNKGSGAVSWLIGDINYDKRAEVMMQYQNGSELAISVFGWNGKAMVERYLSARTGEDPGAVHWMCNRFRSPGRDSILQLYDNGGKLAARQYGQPVSTQIGTVAPAFVVMSIRYAPPGNRNLLGASQVSYLKGRSNSVMHSVTHAFSESVTVSVGVTFCGASAENDFSFSQSSARSTAFTQQRTEQTSVTVGNPAIDGVDHNYDVFQIWLNPLMSATYTDGWLSLNTITCGEVTIGGKTTSSDSMYIAEVAAGYLNKSFRSVPPQVQKILDYLGEDGCKSVLSTNPMLDPSFVLSRSARYQKLRTGIWYSPSATPITQGLSISNSKQQSQTSEDSSSYSIRTKVGGELDGEVFGATESVTHTVDWSTTSITSTSVGQFDTAQVSIVSPSTDYNGGGELVVYLDTHYGTFMFDFADRIPVAFYQPPPVIALP